MAVSIAQEPGTAMLGSSTKVNSLINFHDGVYRIVRRVHEYDYLPGGRGVSQFNIVKVKETIYLTCGEMRELVAEQNAKGIETFLPSWCE
jgi:hypothetical protein